MLERLVVETRELRKLVEVGHEKVEACEEDMKACRKATEACLERLVVIRERCGRGGSEEKSEGKTEANQEKIEAVAEHCKLVQHVKGTHVLTRTAMQGRASDVLYGVLKMRRTRGLSEQLRTDVDTSTLPESPAVGPKTVVNPCRSAFPALHKDHVRRGTGKTFCNGVETEA
jgi:hypothetical protein